MASTDGATLKPVARAAFDRVYDSFLDSPDFVEVRAYYESARARYWESLRILIACGLSAKARVVEFGGGQLAILLRQLYGMDCTVADVSADYRAPVDRAGATFAIGNLADDPPIEGVEPFDLVIMLEVIEHVPEPASVVFQRLKRILAPGGRIFLTTPNLFRLRNIVRMVRGTDVFDRFQVATPGVSLGHQTEYSMDHLAWQIREAGLEVEHIEETMLGAVGHSTGARLARRVVAPLTWRNRWKEELAALARMPA